MPSPNDSQDHERLLVDEALDQPSGPQRDQWLRSACAGNDGLEERIQELPEKKSLEAEMKALTEKQKNPDKP